MESGVTAIGACLVLHDPAQIVPLQERVLALRKALGRDLDCALMLSASGGLSVAHVRASFESAGVSVFECRIVDDAYFDFSGYGEGAGLFVARGTQGVVFINDTLVFKHDSDYLLRAMADKISNCDSSDAPFPVLAGPYRQSEFSSGVGHFDEFVATFFFYLNAPGVRLFADLLLTLPLVHSALLDPEAPQPHLCEPLLRVCRLHAAQLRHRYRSGMSVDSRLSRKLTTVYMERELALRVRADGVIWYVAGGLVGRLAVPLQVGWNRLLKRLVPFKTA